jgi:acyl-CoA synthetase (AMP-forming)/AMP-acid ligase II
MPEEVIEFCKKNMARYKAPKPIEIVDENPKSGTGEILKKEMRKNTGVEVPGESPIQRPFGF